MTLLHMKPHNNYPKGNKPPIKTLEDVADYIIRIDGDRDEDSTSNLRCKFTVELAKLLRKLHPNMIYE